MKITLMKNLTKRYLLALGIIALLSSTAYFNLIQLIKTQDMMAATINISGRQRMLSQKIALLGLQMVNSKNSDSRSDLRHEIHQTVSLMQKSHAGLLQDIKETSLPGVAKQELQAIYFSSPHHLNAEIYKFISCTQALVSTSDEKLSLNNSDLVYILNAADGNLLSSLDKAVSVYQKESEARITLLKHLELAILILTFVVLLMIAVFIFRPMIKLIYRETKQLTDANSELRQLSSIDGLTGIANRRYFDQYFVEMWQRSHLYASWLSLIMIDIDYFKNYNDSYGHQQGDQCLVQVATALNNSMLRKRDLVARYGGEEFVVLLPDTDLKEASVVAEKLRVSIEQLAIPHVASSVANYVTISIGVTSTIPAAATASDYLFKRADMALYAAKREGRNQVKLANSIVKGSISFV